MQGSKAKHIKLARYLENTRNAKKSDRWWVVFRHEYIAMIWLRELNPVSIIYKKKKTDSYIPKRVTSAQYCYCGNLKNSPSAKKCSICSSEIIDLISKSVNEDKVDCYLK